MFNLFKKNNSKNTEYKFSESPDTACFVCDHVLSNQRQILSVTHDHDGTWQFLCGKNDHDETNARLISMVQATNIDKTINDLYEMPIGVGAERKFLNDKWEAYRIPDESDNT